MDVFDAFFLTVMVFFILLLLCAIIGKIIAKQREEQEKLFSHTVCPIYTLDIENHTAA